MDIKIWGMKRTCHWLIGLQDATKDTKDASKLLKLSLSQY
jgi:hypothetical protein